MCSKFTAIVGCYGFQVLALVGKRQPPYRLCKQRSILSIFQLCHDKEVGTSLYHGKNGIAVAINDEIHFPVTETFPIRFRWTLMDALAVSYVGSCLLDLRMLVAVFHHVSAILGQFTAFICPNHLIDSFMGDVYALILLEPT